MMAQWQRGEQLHQIPAAGGLDLSRWLRAASASAADRGDHRRPLRKAEGFALAGGAALIARGKVQRQTRASISSV
jgi:hypothetical protein